MATKSTQSGVRTGSNRKASSRTGTGAKAKQSHELRIVCYVVLDPSHESVEPIFLAADLEQSRSLRRAEAFLHGINSLRRNEPECVLREAQATITFDGREPSETWRRKPR